MEVKLSKRQRADNFPSLPNITNPFRNQSLHVQSWPNTAKLFKKQLRGLALIWRSQVQEMLKGQPSSTNHDLVHVVKEGETLSSISKLYGVPSNAIAAANTNMVVIDLVFRGQRLNIPSAIGDTRAIGDNFLLQDQIHGSLDQKSFISPRLAHVPMVKNTGCLLVLVPFIALCIRCSIVALCTRLSGLSKHDRRDKSEGQDPRFRGGRWKSALSDLRDPDSLDAKSTVDSNSVMEDEAQNSHEETFHNYEKLERDYQNFLSECGLNKWGYWRGGSHE